MLEQASSGSDHAKPATAPSLFFRHPAFPSSKKPRQLTPQFHWTLNDSAIQCLSDTERVALYDLFRFYDSSTTGDALPAIHLGRFLELLRDAHLLDPVAGEDAFSAETAECVFAQAVLGKLRTYLDADDEPALTFQLFSGALLHCAMLKYPEVAHPEQAFRKMLERLLSQPPPGSSSSSGSRGLVQHAEDAAIPSWSVQDLHRRLSDGPTMSPGQEGAGFLNRPMFRHVLADLCRDKLADDAQRERFHELYALPDELTSYFNAKTIRLVTDRFRVFDVLDKGVIPRDEVFALLSGLARPLEITDVYEVLAVILAGEWGDRKQMPRGSLVLTAPSSVTCVSLVQVLNAIYICRRARSASYQTQQHPSRKLGGVAAAQAKHVATSETGGASEDRHGESTRKKAAAIRHGPSSKAKSSDKRAVRGKNSVSVAAQPPHKQASPAKSPLKQNAGPSSQQASTSPTKRISPVKKERKAAVATVDTGLLRRLSKMSTASSSESNSHATAPEMEDDTDAAAVHLDSFRSASSSSSAANNTVKIPTGIVEATLPKGTTVPRESWPSLAKRVDDTPQERVDVGKSMVAPGLHLSEPLQAAALTLRLFYTPGKRPSLDNLDGAMCLTLQLFLVPSPRRIVTTQGIYFAADGDRDEIWHSETLLVDETRPTEAAIVTLKQRVQDHERVGFRLVPDLEQRETMERLMRELRDAKCPRYAAALHSPVKMKTTRRGTVVLDDTVPRPSLERGPTRVRERAPLDLLGELQGRKRQSSRQGRGETEEESKSLHRGRTPDSPNSRRPCEMLRELQYDQIVHTLGLDQPQDAWITLLSEPERPRLRTSQSLPVLARHPQTFMAGNRTQERR